MAINVRGRIGWSAQQDKDGHRDFFITWLVETDDNEDGPERIANTAVGLPQVGATWTFGNDNDTDALCWPTIKLKKFKAKNEPGNWWTASQVFSTKPLNRCQTSSVTNPLAEPDRIGGSFTKYTQEEHIDKDGEVIMSSSFELYRGSDVEFDRNRPSVRIGKNYSTQQLATFAPMIDTVNDATLWGLASRRVKLSDATWTRKLYGTCTYYYEVEYVFDVSYETFDRKLVDEGTMVLDPAIRAAGINPEHNDPATGEAYYLNPNNYVRRKDDSDENTPRGLLNGKGEPLGATQNPVVITFERYAESNFLSLGIPSTL